MEMKSSESEILKSKNRERNCQAWQMISTENKTKVKTGGSEKYPKRVLTLKGWDRLLRIQDIFSENSWVVTEAPRFLNFEIRVLVVWFCGFRILSSRLPLLFSPLYLLCFEAKCFFAFIYDLLLFPICSTSFWVLFL